MRERLLDGNALVRIERQHAMQQVKRAAVCAGEQLRPWHARLVRQGFQVAPSL